MSIVSQVALSARSHMIRADADSYPLYDSQISQQLNDSKIALRLTQHYHDKCWQINFH